MQTKHFTSREFNRDTGGAKRAAREGPVFITDRGRPSHVLLSIDDYKRMASEQLDIIQLMGQPAGVEDIELEIPAYREVLGPAKLD